MDEDSHILPDVLAQGLKIVFCGTAAGRRSAEMKAYYAHPQNQFWRTLAAVGLTPQQLQPQQFRDLLTYGLGLTDLAKHHAGMDHELPQSAFDAEAFHARIQQYAPLVLAFTSKKAGEVYLKRPVAYGMQPESIGSTRLFVLPSPSPAARGAWDVQHWQALAKLVRA